MNEFPVFRFRISGNVQGVGYRYYAYKNARILDIIGYAKNLTDGSVEVVASGNMENIKKFELILKQGPSRGRVDELKREEFPQDEIYYGFEII